MSEYEEVDHPQHYNSHPTGIECIDVVEEMNFNIGNAIKYLWRAGLKPGTDISKDLEKAAWYVDRESIRISMRSEEDTEQPEGLEDVNDDPQVRSV